MQLLDMVSDQALTSSLAKYTFEAQMSCQAYCESEIIKTTSGAPQDTQAIQNLSTESARALEKQCNKQCVKKFFKSYMLYNKLIKQTPEGLASK
jgi:hypothetical protein